MGLKTCQACAVVKNTGCFPKRSERCIRCVNGGKRAKPRPSMPAEQALAFHPKPQRSTSVSWWLVPAEQFALVAHAPETKAQIAAGRFGPIAMNVGLAAGE